MSGDSRRILVAGMGNIFLGDDAFGVEVARRLVEHPPPGDVRVVDFGINGMQLAYTMLEGYDLVILVDAVSRGSQPGTIYLIEPEAPQGGAGGEAGETMLDPHSMDPATTLRLVRSMGGYVGRLLLVGCEPSAIDESADINGGLSDAVRGAVDQAVRLIGQMVAPEAGGDANRERISSQAPLGEPLY